jgi:hypothetical protein
VNDYTTYRVGPPAEDADRVIAAVRAVAEERNPGPMFLLCFHIPGDVLLGLGEAVKMPGPLVGVGDADRAWS